MLARFAAIGVSLLAITAAARAEFKTFTTTLNLTPQQAGEHAFAAASFDFGTKFSQIQSLRLWVTLADDYEGGGYEAGYSSSYQQLLFSLLETLPTTASEAEATLFSLNASGAQRINGGEPIQQPLAGPSAFIVRPPNEFNFVAAPDYVHAGKGIVAISDHWMYFREDMLTGGGIYQQSFALPPTITSVQLELIGVAVPEPASFIVLSAVAVGSWVVARPRQRAKIECKFAL